MPLFNKTSYPKYSTLTFYCYLQNLADTEWKQPSWFNIVNTWVLLGFDDQSSSEKEQIIQVKLNKKDQVVRFENGHSPEDKK
jgi:hypothetical protein